MSDDKQYPLADLWRNRRTVQVPVVYHGRIESDREPTKANAMQGQSSELPTKIVYRCSCPRCQGLLESTDTFYGIAKFRCVCKCEFELAIEWTQEIPYRDSAQYLTSRLQSAMDARD